MSALWLPALLVTVVALGFLVVPFFINRGTALAREDFDVAVYKDQLKEVDRDLARGFLGETEAIAARTEIQRRLLSAAPENKAADGTGSRVLNRAAAGVIAVVVPVSAFLLYDNLGSPTLRDHPLSLRPVQTAAMQQADAQADADAQAEAKRMADMVAELARRMESDPDNQEGWSILARSYASVGQFAEAASAYNQLLRLSDRAPDILSAYGEILIMVQKDGMVPAISVTVFKEALEKNPTDPRAQFYLGLADAQTGNVQGAFDTWLKLYETSPAGAPWLPEIATRLQAAAKQLGIEDKLPQSVTAPAPAMAQPGPVQPSAQPGLQSGPQSGPSGAQIKEAETMSADERDVMIRSMVERLANRLAENPNDREGWLRLARAYEVLGEREKAAKAEARAAALGGN